MTSGMSSRCRYCGDVAALSDDEACPRCTAAASCDRCGHPRTAHVGSFRDGRGCAHVWVEQPASLATGCGCAGFMPAQQDALDEELLLVVRAQPARIAHAS